MGRDEAIWGPDAGDFKPERFIGTEPSPYMFPSFKAGPRLCLGKGMAMEELLVVAHRLFRRFKFSFDGTIEEVPQESGLTLKPVLSATLMGITERYATREQ